MVKVSWHCVIRPFVNNSQFSRCQSPGSNRWSVLGLKTEFVSISAVCVFLLIHFVFLPVLVLCNCAECVWPKEKRACRGAPAVSLAYFLVFFVYLAAYGWMWSAQHNRNPSGQSRIPAHIVNVNEIITKILIDYTCLHWREQPVSVKNLDAWLTLKKGFWVCST